jgi:hypothetical protein
VQDIDRVQDARPSERHRRRREHDLPTNGYARWVLGLTRSAVRVDREAVTPTTTRSPNGIGVSRGENGRAGEAGGKILTAVASSAIPIYPRNPVRVGDEITAVC